MSRTVVRRVAKVIMITANLIVVVLFLLACISPYINPSKWWFSGFTGLIFPFLLLALIFFTILWLFARPRLALIPVITLLIGWKQISVIFAWHPRAGFSKEHPADVLRLVDWNVHGFNGADVSDVKRNIVHELSSSIIRLNPDVVCLQEFNTAESEDHIKPFLKDFPFYFFSDDVDGNRSYQSGCIIFSKYRIINSGRIKYPSQESLVFADIVRGNDTLRVYTTHLQSFKFGKTDYSNLAKIKNQEDEHLAASKSIYRKMKTAFNLRGGQADVAHDEIAKSPYPSIICGDFNDVPNSYTYFRIRGNRQDAFLKKSFGIGRSFIALSPTLRIDYILPTDHFEVKQFDMVDEDLSDHIMLVTDLVLKK
ncbi:endonuclease/exonuclease/phosphatase family protein [Sediminibacterium roseum]|uniref:Endonuclease/exonuclease/phosphatase family protein n=1 Tax=Sediminibacterium roseum TaxID=1978412 RepID=A0ABW9ZZD7_9BACT|nr:endonuclease/exonuclease/phosphatase family protein [Sediminibacterium roseum]NCI51915.1 endonuclease/exonuclease/phosphatase family protein [Sediminibacterium roseum]